MRKLWSILLLILACNGASLAARIAMLDIPISNLVQCYIDEQEDDYYSLIDHNSNCAFEHTVNINPSISPAPATVNNFSKNSPFISGRTSHTDYHQELFSSAFITRQNELYEHLNRRVKDHYIYALRRIII